MPEPMTLEEAVKWCDLPYHERHNIAEQFGGPRLQDQSDYIADKNEFAYSALMAHARATLAQRREGVTEAMVESREDFDNALIGYGEQIIRSHYMAYVNRYGWATKEYAEKVMREIIRNVDRFMERERTGLAARAASGEAALGARDGGAA